MKPLLTTIACCLAVAGSAQSDAYPFNPDADADGIIGIADLLALLADFGSEAEVETCFKGEVYRVEGWDSFYIPNDCGTLLVISFTEPTQQTILAREGYDEGDVIHVTYTYDTFGFYTGTSRFYYADDFGELVQFAQLGPSFQRGSTKFVFSNGVWTWNGDYDSSYAPTEPID